MPSAIGATLIPVHPVAVAPHRPEVELPAESLVVASRAPVGPAVASECSMVALPE
ncbi:MAG: hypothetical protein ABTQ32_22445 [Myxococcaceae bacterium]